MSKLSIDLKSLLKKRVLIIDGAMGTQIQNLNIPEAAWEGCDGCNELLNVTFKDGIKKIHKEYLEAGADIVKTNTFGSIAWVLDDYDIGDRAYELSYNGAKIVKELCDEFTDSKKPRFAAGVLGPGTKLPSLGHISFDEMYSGYKESAFGLIDGGCDLFLLETCQDPLQIKAAICACKDAMSKKKRDLPIMVSVTIELSGTMLIGTDAKTIVTILEPFDILSLGFNCGTGPQQVKKHIKKLSKLWDRPISIHANAGLPQNRGGVTFYPMDEDEFSKLQVEFLEYDGVSLLGGCCGTTPKHISKLVKMVNSRVPKAPTGKSTNALASLFDSIDLIQDPPPFLVGERSNATGSKAFRELLLAEDYEGTLSVAQEQTRSGAHCIDISVGFAGRDESRDMEIVSSLYAQKITLPLMVDSTSADILEVGLKNIGARAIINSVNLEDGEKKFDKIVKLAKRYGAALVCLAIDEDGMAKSRDKKIEIAKRIYNLCTKKYNMNPSDLIFDLLTFTVGSGDEESYTAAIDTIDAIAEFKKLFPKVGFVLGVSNISFGLNKNAREYLNSVFLDHCIKAGLTMAIVNVKNTIPLNKMSKEDIKVCNDLLFNKREDGDPLFKFIDHFSEIKERDKREVDSIFNQKSTREKIHSLLIDGDKERMLKLLNSAKDEIEPEEIVNSILINAMKEVGELFGSGKMQLPFVLQSAETMKSSVEYLNPYLPKKSKESIATLVIGTVKGDVHDVGKNLVDIILSNNGFRVINIGIKADISDFIKAYKEHNADAIGMSGLLVKSTAVMLENLQELKESGISVPILLGGAALNRKFVDEYCRPNYDGAIFYCKDAFDGVVAMGRIERGGELDTDLGGNNEALDEVKIKKREKVVKVKLDDIKMPSRDIEIPTPPFWGRRVLKTDLKELSFDWINHKLLFSKRWGYGGKNRSKEERKREIDDKLWPLYEKIKRDILKKDLFRPVKLYGYFPCRSDGNTLLIFDQSEGWFKDGEVNREALEVVRSRAIYKIEFPRQNRAPYRSISDYFRSDRHDVIGFTLASAGGEFSIYEKTLYDRGEFSNYHHLHGISVELAEAVAQILHKQIRLELGIAKDEGDRLRDVRLSRYRGARYSFGYASCPNLEDNRVIFDLLKPEEFGIILNENYQMVPEQSTSALVVHHKEALYFSI